MAGPQLVRVVAVAFPALFAVGFGVTFLMKLQHAEQRADSDEKRRPRSLSVDPTLPDWFRNLDRDTDGRVTRAEFVGTVDTFHAIDTDRNGEITPAEAWAADVWFRRQVVGES